MKTTPRTNQAQNNNNYIQVTTTKYAKQQK